MIRKQIWGQGLWKKSIFSQRSLLFTNECEYKFILHLLWCSWESIIFWRVFNIHWMCHIFSIENRRHNFWQENMYFYPICKFKHHLNTDDRKIISFDCLWPYCFQQTLHKIWVFFSFLDDLWQKKNCQCLLRPPPLTMGEMPRKLSNIN